MLSFQVQIPFFFQMYSCSKRNKQQLFSAHASLFRCTLALIPPSECPANTRTFGAMLH